MADELQRDEAGQETPRGIAPEPSQQDAEPGFGREPRKRRGALGRLWSRLVFALAWLRHPDRVGRPLVLQPHSVRLLALLVLANLLALVLLAVSLYQATTMPLLQRAVVESPLTPIAPAISADTGPSPTPGLTPTPNDLGGAIAFTLRRNGNADVYALNQADRQLVRLTYDPAEDRDPTWSPDGNYVAFASNRAHNWDIYLLDLLSGTLIRLTHDPGFDANPSWSPDGQWIAFESYRGGNLDIYVMSVSASGEQVRRVTTRTSTSGPAPNYEPAWSPDSRALAYTTLQNGNKDVYVQLLDEPQSAINVTNSPDLDEYDPAWSPDGTRLAYVSGPRGNPSIQVTGFDWSALAADQAQTELFGAGTSPAWAPDGESLVYAVERGGRGHLVAASTAGWALFHEVYNTDGLLDSLAWANLSLSARVVARAQADAPAEEPAFYVELAQPTPRAGPPYQLVPLPNVTAEEQPLLSDRVNESFNAVRQRAIEETGWDYLGTLASTWRPLTYTPPSGHSRMSWHLCGRGIGLDQAPYEANPAQVELVREDVGNVTYWRAFVRAARQDGSMGEPLREAVWDLNARDQGGSAMVEGGALESRIPAGYYVDLTMLAADYGWERVPALWRWRYFWPDIRWWEFLKTDGLTWWQCMQEVFEPKQIEAAFGPIPDQ